MINLNGDKYGISFSVDCFGKECTLVYNITFYNDYGKLSPLSDGFVDFGKDGINSKIYTEIENDIIRILSKL